MDNDDKQSAQQNERDIKSEYDYGSRKKFVDVLGNIKKNDGLKGLEELNRHPGAKNMETASKMSRMSRASRVASIRS